MTRILESFLTISLFVSPIAFAAPATLPATTQPAAGSYEAYQLHGTEDQKRFKVLVPSNEVLADSNAAEREVISVKAVPLLKAEVMDLDNMARLKPGYKWQIMAVRWGQESMLYAFGDPETVTAVSQTAGKSGRDGNRAKRILLRARWYKAGQDADKQAAVVADVDKMAAEQPSDAVLTQLIADMRTSAQDPMVKNHLMDLLTDTMDNPTADSNLNQIVASDKVHSFNGKPMVLAGKLMDGQDFTTADWKGKVVLVDFWATWCAPCRAELPRVQKMYADYHDKGLEVLAISNDQDGKMLKKVVGNLNLPWPELFDPEAAAKNAWNPITVQHGINGIPVMFLIDKKGVCRTVTARDNFEQMIPQLLAE